MVFMIIKKTSLSVHTLQRVGTVVIQAAQDMRIEKTTNIEIIVTEVGDGIDLEVGEEIIEMKMDILKSRQVKKEVVRNEDMQMKDEDLGKKVEVDMDIMMKDDTRGIF